MKITKSKQTGAILITFNELEKRIIRGNNFNIEGMIEDFLESKFTK